MKSTVVLIVLCFFLVGCDGAPRRADTPGDQLFGPFNKQVTILEQNDSVATFFSSAEDVTLFTIEPQFYSTRNELRLKDVNYPAIEIEGYPVLDSKSGIKDAELKRVVKFLQKNLEVRRNQIGESYSPKYAIRAVSGEKFIVFIFSDCGGVRASCAGVELSENFDLSPKNRAGLSQLFDEIFPPKVLVDAVGRGNLRAVNRLLAQSVKGIDGNHPCESPLYLAIWNQEVEMAKSLIEHGANVNAKDDDGTTPLHWAAHCERPATVQLLIDMGADVNAISSFWGTPLGVATRYFSSDQESERQRKEIIRILRSSGGRER